MTHTKDEAFSTERALKLALEALDRYVKEDEVAEGMPGNEPWVETKRMGEKAITAIKQSLLTATPLAAPVQPVQFEIGGRYNWKGQQERLIYMGYNFSGNGRWHQFAKVETPEKVWCEVQPEDLSSFEATPPAAQRQWVGLTEDEINEVYAIVRPNVRRFWEICEAKLKEKNCD